MTVAEEGRIFFVEDVVLVGFLCSSSWLTSIHTWAAETKISGCKKKKAWIGQGHVEKNTVGVKGRNWGWGLDKVFHTCMNFLSINKISKFSIDKHLNYWWY